MKDPRIISGFSRLSKDHKLELVSKFVKDPHKFTEVLKGTWHHDAAVQKLYDEFSENTIANYFFPFGIAPNFLINDRMFSIPMVIEESSVVAAASGAAKFWSERGGFHSEVKAMKKIGQVHFLWRKDPEILVKQFAQLKKLLFERTAPITANMVKRGGGMLDVELVDMTDKLADYYQLKCTFDTRDSMGANFINTCLEEIADITGEYMSQLGFSKGEDLEVIMSILTNYTPECIVHTWVECDLGHHQGFDEAFTDRDFVRRFETGVHIAEQDVYRATTHNKGIFNGVDAVALATGNDFRAIEACGHAYASRDGRYRSLSYVQLEGDRFRFGLELPMSVGTIGGITKLHPMARYALEILGNPDAATLMQIASASGLANNFAAVKSLVTKGIQKGHMKMHLMNILNVFHATEAEKMLAIEEFKHEKVSYNAVEQFLHRTRNLKPGN